MHRSVVVAITTSVHSCSCDCMTKPLNVAKTHFVSCLAVKLLQHFLGAGQQRGRPWAIHIKQALEWAWHVCQITQITGCLGIEKIAGTSQAL